MGKTKATIDTNIFISALGWKGNPKKVFDKVVHGEIELVISHDQLDELIEVLEYPKFQFTSDQKERFKSLVLALATLVDPTEKIDIIKNDPDDNKILEGAIAGKVEYIITGDPDLLKIKEFRGIKIRTAREFLNEYYERQRKNV